MGVICAVELLGLHLLVKLASTQPVWLTCGWIRLLELTALPLEWFLRVLGSLADPTLLISALKLTTRITLPSFFGRIWSRWLGDIIDDDPSHASAPDGT